MEDSVLEQIQIHEDALRTDANSPLYLIREKEMEISGRMLAARQEAERLVAEARRKAADVTTKAEEEGDRLAREHEEKRLGEAQAEASRIRAGLSAEAAPLEARIAERHGSAVDAVVGMVTAV